MTDNKRQQIEALIDKAAKANMSDEAVRFSQAALNAANAMCSLASAENDILNGRVDDQPR